ncbi:SDR family NAD(P)-dependent oxidoreductase, partial [Streptococcus suis]
NVVLNGRGQLVQDLLDSFADYGVKVLAISGDSSSAEDAKRMVAEAIETLGSVEILVNNAGITKDGIALRMTEEDFDTVLKVNINRHFNM